MTTYSIDKTNKLIDLNGDKTNFKCSFQCKSENGEDFDVAVTDQNTLDNETLNYQKTLNGSLSKTFTSNNNIYQNHFLVLKSEYPTNVIVTIDLQEVHRKMPSDEEIRKLDMLQQQVEQFEQHTDSVEPKYNYTRIFLCCLVGIGLISIAYYFYTIKKETSSPEPNLYLDLEQKIDDILKSSNEEVVSLQPEMTPVLSPSYTEVASPENIISSPIRSPNYLSAYNSPVREASSPDNNISNTIHEKLMDKPPSHTNFTFQNRNRRM